MNKFYWSIILAVFIIASGLIIYFGYAPESKMPAKEQIGENEASLLIDFGAKKRMFIGEVTGNMTVLDALAYSAGGETFSNFSYSFDPSSKALAAIDDFSNNGKHWTVYVNGVKTDKPLDETILKAKDEVELKLE